MIENTLDFYVQLEQYFPLYGSEESKQIKLERFADRLEEYINQRLEEYSLDRLLDVLVETHKNKELPLFSTIIDKLSLAKIKRGFSYDEQCASLWVRFSDGVWQEFVLPKGMPPGTAIDLGKKNYKRAIDWKFCPVGCGFNWKKGEVFQYE